MSSTVAIYTRLSQDRDGTKASTKRQEADCRALAKARGWKVTKVYTDQGFSAFNGKDRPAFAEMLAAVESRRVSGVVAWKVDRLGRRTVDVVSLIERVSDLGGFVTTCDGLDSSTPTGKAVMGVAGIFAQLESESTAARTTRAKLQTARDGKPSGGGRRPFGYQPGGMKLRPREARMIREAASHILDGGSLRAITNAWNRAHISSAGGGAWAPSALRRLLMSDRIAGLRSYKGATIGAAAWPAIVTPEQHEALVAILSDPRRRTSRAGARRYLLTGLTHCALCGSVMVAAPVRGVRAYACRSQRRGNGGCGGVRILAEPFEGHVVAAMMEALDTPALTKLRRAERGNGEAAKLARSLRRDEASLERLTTDHYVDSKLGRQEFMAAHEALTRRMESSRRQLADLAASKTASRLPSAGAELKAQWAVADTEWRRAVAEAVIERVDIGRSRARGQTDLDRVAIAWRD